VTVSGGEGWRSEPPAGAMLPAWPAKVVGGVDFPRHRYFF